MPAIVAQDIAYSGKYLRQSLDHLSVRFLAMRKQHASLAARAQKASMPHVAPAAKARPLPAGPGVDVDPDMCLLGLLTNAPSQSAASGAQRAKRVKTQQSTRYRAKMETIEKNPKVMCSSRHVFHVLAVTEGLTEYFAAAEFVQSSTQVYFPVFARTVAVQDYLREASGKLAALEAPPRRTTSGTRTPRLCAPILRRFHLRRGQLVWRSQSKSTIHGRQIHLPRSWLEFPSWVFCGNSSAHGIKVGQLWMGLCLNTLGCAMRDCYWLRIANSAKT
jgi:hypothetical protein